MIPQLRISGTKKPTFFGLCHFQSESGGRGRIRTSDRLVRSQVLYPAELRVRNISAYLRLAMTVSFKHKKTDSLSVYAFLHCCMNV